MYKIAAITVQLSNCIL